MDLGGLQGCRLWNVRCQLQKWWRTSRNRRWCQLQEWWWTRRNNHLAYHHSLEISPAPSPMLSQLPQNHNSKRQRREGQSLRRRDRLQCSARWWTRSAVKNYRWMLWLIWHRIRKISMWWCKNSRKRSRLRRKRRRSKKPKKSQSISPRNRKRARRRQLQLRAW